MRVDPSMPFAIPRIWREQQNQVNDCHFCILDISRFKRTKNWRYHISNTPVSHSEQLPVLRPTAKDLVSEGEHFKYESDEEKKRPRFQNQQELDDLIRGLGLTMSNAELLTSRLTEWILLDNSLRHNHLYF